jgi:predicted transcriptional regulator
VKKFSGCNFRYLERESMIPAGTLQYHLHYLTKHKLITTQKDGNKIRYFTQSVTAKDKTLLTFLRQKNIRHIILFILTHKEGRQRDLIDFLKLSPSTVSGYLSRLMESQILQVIEKKKEIYYHLAVKETDIISLLMTYKESFLDSVVDQTIDMWTFQ